MPDAVETDHGGAVIGTEPRVPFVPRRAAACPGAVRFGSRTTAPATMRGGSASGSAPHPSVSRAKESPAPGSLARGWVASTEWWRAYGGCSTRTTVRTRPPHHASSVRSSGKRTPDAGGAVGHPDRWGVPSRTAPDPHQEIPLPHRGSFRFVSFHPPHTRATHGPRIASNRIVAGWMRATTDDRG